MASDDILNPLPVHGYTDQKVTAVDQVNVNKLEEERLLRLMDAIAADTSLNVDQRCVALARTKLQEAFMWLNRGIFKPQRITGTV